MYSSLFEGWLHATNMSISYLLYMLVYISRWISYGVWMRSRPNRYKYQTESIPTWDIRSYWETASPPDPPAFLAGEGCCPPAEVRISWGASPIKLSIEYRQYQTGRSFGWQIKSFILFGAKSSRWKKCYASRFGVSFENSQIVGKSSACPVGVFSMRPNPPKCHILQKSRKSIILLIKCKIPWISA